MKTIRSILKSHADRKSKLTVQTFSADRSEPGEQEQAPLENYVLIEGDNESLRFLGELLIAFAEGDWGCSYDLHPKRAGSAHFSEASTVGLYFHKKPCDVRRPGESENRKK
jgi:hypothetical protein